MEEYQSQDKNKSNDVQAKRDGPSLLINTLDLLNFEICAGIKIKIKIPRKETQRHFQPFCSH